MAVGACCPGVRELIIRRTRCALMLATLLWLAGCAEMPPIDGEAGEERLSEMVEAGEWNAIAGMQIRCGERTEACARAHAAKGDACLRLVIQQPQSASATDGRTRKLLDCAEGSYRTALSKLPSVTDPGRISYHGGLLLTLSERRNRLDAQTREQRLDRENEKLLKASEDARREAPSSALGYLYGASAHAYRAVLKPQGSARCDDLRRAEAMLKRSPPPPSQLVAEQTRIASLIKRELKLSRCPAVRRR